MVDDNVEEVDRLSQLHEDLFLHILSFLPTKFAVRTSLLARTFRHLWTDSPSVELDRSDFSDGRLFNSVKTLIMEQRNLEYLCIKCGAGDDVDLSSQSVKTLKLRVTLPGHNIYLSFSKLEFLDLNISLGTESKQFHGDMPVLRKALVDIFPLSEENVPVLRDILKSITNVSELTLHIMTPNLKTRGPVIRLQELTSFDLCHPLVEPGRDMPDFPNLRSLTLSMCCSENALQDVICVLRHSPCIDSLHLSHVEGPSCYREHREVWHSKLPLNSEGNRKDALFSNLQTGDKKNEVIKLLSGENSSKRRKI